MNMPASNMNSALSGLALRLVQENALNEEQAQQAYDAAREAKTPLVRYQP